MTIVASIMPQGPAFVAGYIPPCGTPVIGVREGGIPETIKDGRSDILIGRNEKECTDAIERILSDDILCRRLRQAGPDYVRHYWSLEERTQELEESLTSIKERYDDSSGDLETTREQAPPA